MTKKTMHIGLDDTDSTRKGCTTYVAALLVEKLQRLDAVFIDYPNLIRLNPNVPWKTRGNGALCLRIKYNTSAEDRIKETVISTVEAQSDMQNRGTDPGIVFFLEANIPRELHAFAKNTITGISKLNDAASLLRKYKGEALAFKNGRGIIGALAAVGETLGEDYTYEAIAYRTVENRGTKRTVNASSIFQMDKSTRPWTFNNVDQEKKRVIVTPRGPDPVLLGIRGETAEAVKKALNLVNVLEPIERWVIFRTNQGTDAHLKRVKHLGQIEPYNSVIANAEVSANPKMIRGRHIIFTVKDENCEVDCAAYEPTGVLRSAARQLIIGDQIQVFGGVRPPSQTNPMTINLEKIRVKRLAPQIAFFNPLCSECGKRLESMGTHQGFRCKGCGRKYPATQKVGVHVVRNLKKGLYITSIRSQRHLAKPSSRYGLEKRNANHKSLISNWSFP